MIQKFSVFNNIQNLIERINVYIHKLYVKNIIVYYIFFFIENTLLQKYTLYEKTLQESHTWKYKHYVFFFNLL